MSRQETILPCSKKPDVSQAKKQKHLGQVARLYLESNGRKFASARINIFAYFNNDDGSAHAIENARKIKSLLAII